MGFSMKEWRAQRRKRMLQKAEADEQAAEKEAEQVSALSADDAKLEEKKEGYRVKISGQILKEEGFIRELGGLEQNKYTSVKTLARFAQAGRALANAGRAVSSKVTSCTKRIAGSIRQLLRRAVMGGMAEQMDKIIQSLGTEQRNNIAALEKDVQMQINENRAELARYQTILANVEKQKEVLGNYSGFIAAQEREIMAAIATVKKQIADEAKEIQLAKDENVKEATAAKEVREAFFRKMAS